MAFSKSTSREIRTGKVRNVVVVDNGVPALETCECAKTVWIANVREILSKRTTGVVVLLYITMGYEAPIPNDIMIRTNFHLFLSFFIISNKAWTYYRTLPKSPHLETSL